MPSSASPRVARGARGGNWHALSRQRGTVLRRMSALTFNAVYEDAGDGWVYAHVPELPEVHTQGESLQDAREMVP